MPIQHMRTIAGSSFVTRGACAAALLACAGTALAQPAGVTVTDLGNFAGNASTVQTATIEIAPSLPVRWFKIRLPRITDPHRFLDISTSGSNAGFDTEIGLYNADGGVIASDDDDGANNYSALSFGITNPSAAGRVAPITAPGQSAPALNDGRDGTLSGNPQVGLLGTAGDYYIAVTQWNADFLDGFVINRLNGPVTGLATLLTVRMGTPGGQVAPTVDGSDAFEIVGNDSPTLEASASSNASSVIVDLSSIGASAAVQLFFAGGNAWSGGASVATLSTAGAFPLLFRASNAIGDVTVDQATLTVRQLAPTCGDADERLIASPPGTSIYTYSTTLGDVDGPWTNACYTSVPTGNDVWFRFTPTQSGTLTLSTCNSDTGVTGGQPDTLLGIRTTCNTAFITCGDDVGGCGLGTKLSNIPVTAGQQYNIAVRAFSGDITGGRLAVTFTPAFVPPTQNTAPAGGGQAFDNRQQSIALSLVTRSSGIFGLGVPVRLFAYPRSTIVSGSLSGGAWLPLEGQLLPIASNQAMFTEIGNTFGGNGTTNFAIPDARERVIVADGNAVDGVSYFIGDTFGTAQQIFTTNNLPPHTHSIVGANPFTGSAGLGQAFENAQPSLVLPMLVARQGIFPSFGGNGGGAAPGDPFLGQILLTCRVPTVNGFTQAGGAVLPISQNSALFALYGTAHGGNGSVNFALPDLRGRTPIYAPDGNTTSGVGQVVGLRQRTLSTANLPPHTHGTPSGPTGPVGSSTPFDNRQTSLGVQYAIASVGVFPSSGGVSDQDPYLGEIILFGGTNPPNGMIPCDGRLLSISQNSALFALIGTTFGGNGTTNFAVPDLRNRAVVGASASWPVGEVRGSNTVTMTLPQMPAHTHTYVSCSLSDVAGPNQSIGSDGVLTADDIIVFLSWFFASDSRANVAGANQSTVPDDTFTADDIIVFLGRYFGGC